MAPEQIVQSERPMLTGRRDFLVAGALLSAALLAGVARRQAGLEPNTGGTSLDELIPNRIGAWRQSRWEEVMIPTGEAPNDDYDDVLTRYYSDGTGSMIMLLAAFGNAQTGNAQIHRPEACYPAAGFSLSNARTFLLPSPEPPKVQARALTAAAPGRIEQVLYWSRIGDDFPTSSARQRWSAFRQSLSGTAPQGVLIRISTISADRKSAFEELIAFAAALLASPAPGLRRLLTGRG